MPTSMAVFCSTRRYCETLIREVCVAEHLLLAAAQQTGRRVKDFVPRQIGGFGILASLMNRVPSSMSTLSSSTGGY